MLGLDDRIAQLSNGTSLWLVALIGLLLGLRHATDPDHLAAMTTLVAGGRERAGRAAARVGLAWGAGHATTLFLFGLPVVLFGRFLPDRAQQLAETAVALVIGYLAVRLIVRWRRGLFHVHVHVHDGVRHVHVHDHVGGAGHGHAHAQRTPLAAYGIGLVHGVGGSAGVSVLILASISSTDLAVVALALLAVFTAVSMTLLTGGFGYTLDSRPVRRCIGAIAPALATLSLAFGVWYATAAWTLTPYPF
jgi:high-affinity nickel permease